MISKSYNSSKGIYYLTPKESTGDFLKFHAAPLLESVN